MKLTQIYPKLVLTYELDVFDGGDVVLVRPGHAGPARLSGGGGAPVLGAVSPVTTGRLDELTDQGYAELHTVLALPGPDGRQLLAVREDDLLGQQGVLPGQGVLGLALVVGQDLALVPADLTGLLGLRVAQREGGETDGGQRELGALVGHLLGGRDDCEHALQLLLNVVVTESLTDVDVVVLDVLGAHLPRVLLAVPAVLVGDEAGVVLLQRLDHVVSQLVRAFELISRH